MSTEDKTSAARPYITAMVAVHVDGGYTTPVLEGKRGLETGDYISIPCRECFFS